MEKFLAPFDIIPFDDRMSYVYSELRIKLEKNGTPIGSNDMFIAATVLSKNGILVTHNTKEFTRIIGLKIEDWVTES